MHSTPGLNSQQVLAREKLESLREARASKMREWITKEDAGHIKW
jgi:hypothetical protein